MRDIHGFHITVPVMRVALADPDMTIQPLPAGEWSPGVEGYSQEIIDFLTVSDIHLVHVNQAEDSVHNHSYAGIVMFQGLPRIVVTVVPEAFFETGVEISLQELFGEVCIWVMSARIDLPS